MSKQINDGGPAFPSPDVHYPNGQVQHGSPGMTLLQWYAGMALQGILANPDANRSWNEGDVSRFCMRQAGSLLSLQDGIMLNLEHRLKEAQRWAGEHRRTISKLQREVELLRLYGDKDCTAMADEALEKEAKP